MKTLILWLGAFGFAIAKHVWENNFEETFYAYEMNKTVADTIKNTRKHPVFFEWYSLTKNIEVIDNYDDLIWDIDLLILAIPSAFLVSTIDSIKDKLKPGITLLNLSKWIDLDKKQPFSQILAEQLRWYDYNYAILSWWMIAKEFVEWKKLWADLAINNQKIWEEIQKLLQSDNLTIKLRKDIVNIELYGSLKNILAIITWYYEARWYNESSIGQIISDFLNEISWIVSIYWWNSVLDFSYYSLGWDIIATCFWDSRNRYLWKLLWSWKNIEEALIILKKENKMAEWYKTSIAIYEKIKDRDWFEMIKSM